MKLKKVTALLLATSMVLSSVSVASFADEEIVDFGAEYQSEDNASDEVNFGDGVVADEQNEEDSAAAEETFFSDEVIDETVADEEAVSETVTDEVAAFDEAAEPQVSEELNAEDTVIEDEAFADSFIIEENADIYAALEKAEQTASDIVSYDISGDMSYKGKYDGQAHGLDLSKSGKAEGEVRFLDPKSDPSNPVYTYTSPTYTHVTVVDPDSSPYTTKGVKIQYQTKEYSDPSDSAKGWVDGTTEQFVAIEPAPLKISYASHTFKEGDQVPATALADFGFDGLVNGETASGRFEVVNASLTPSNFFESSNITIQKWNGAAWVDVAKKADVIDSGRFKTGSAGRYFVKATNDTANANFVDASFNELHVSGQDNDDYTATFIGGEFTITEGSKKEITVLWPDDLTFVYDAGGLKQSYEPSLNGYTFEPTDGTINAAYDTGTYTYTIGKVYDTTLGEDVTDKVTVTNPTHEWTIKKAKAFVFVETGSGSEFEYGVKNPIATLKKTNVTYYKEKTRTTQILDPSVATGTPEFVTTYTQYDPVWDYSGASRTPAYYYVRYKSGLESKNYEIQVANDDTTGHTNAFTLKAAEVSVVPDSITVAFGDDYVEPTYKLEDVNKDSGAGKTLQHDIDAGLVNLSVFTVGDGKTQPTAGTEAYETKITPKNVGTYYYNSTLEDAVKGNHAASNFKTTPGSYVTKEFVKTDANKKYTVNQGEFTIKFSDYEGVYDGKPHSIIVEPDPLPSNVTAYYSKEAAINTSDISPSVTRTDITTTPITFIDAKETPALVYWYVVSDGLGSGLNGSNKVTIKDADKAAAEAVEKQIEDAVKKDESGKLDAQKVKAAREAYDALTNDQKALVDPYDVKALKDAEAEIAASAEADAKAVEEQIAKLPLPEEVTEADRAAIEAAKDAYDKLSDDAKALVSADAKKKLDDDVAALEGKEEADKKAAKAVEDEIEALPEADKATAADKEAADKAKADYDALTDAQKALVDPEAVKKLDAVKAAADAAAEKEAAAKKELEDFDKAVAAVKAAKNGTDGKKAAEDAKKAYDALSDDAKALMTDEEKAAYDATQEAYKKDKTFNSGEGVFKVLGNGEVTYLKPLHPESTWFVVPNMVKKNGFLYKVVKVSTKAFMGCVKATKIKIGKNVQTIGEYAFKNTPAMGKLIMLTSKLTAGKVKNSFVAGGKNGGAKLTNYVPSGKSSAYESLFKGEGGMNAKAKFTESD